MYNDEFIQRFWSKVYIRGEDDCWEWQAGTRNGYGRIGVGNRKMQSAHRVSYSLRHNVLLSENIKVLHKCDNPPCCNPKHLFLGTQKQNMEDMIRKNRSYCRVGSKNPNVKLISADVMQVYRLHNSGISNKKISLRLKCGESTIARIVNGVAWIDLYQQVTHVR